MTTTAEVDDSIQFHSKLWELPAEQRAWLSSLQSGPKKELGVEGKLIIKHDNKEHFTFVTASSSDLLDAALAAYDKKYPSPYAGRK